MLYFLLFIILCLAFIALPNSKINVQVIRIKRYFFPCLIFIFLILLVVYFFYCGIIERRSMAKYAGVFMPHCPVSLDSMRKNTSFTTPSGSRLINTHSSAGMSKSDLYSASSISTGPQISSCAVMP